MGRRLARPAALALALALAGAAVAAASAAKPAKRPAPVRPIYWGAYVGSQLTGRAAPADLDAATVFEAHTGKPMSLLAFGRPWQTCDPNCLFEPFPTAAMESIRQRGQIPVLDWGSDTYPSDPNNPAFRLHEIIDGDYDAYIRSFAAQVAAWGHPFFLRFDWEMNLTAWFPWVEAANGNAPGEYVAMWRHVHDLFAAVGAANVTWVWCPNQVDPSYTPLAELYPGDGYVDWTCMDGYNWGTHPGEAWGWVSLQRIFGDTYRQIRAVAPRKPIMIGETASTEYGGSKAAWTKDALASLPTKFPAVRALVWFDAIDKGMDWPIESSADAQAAFARAIRSRFYAAGGFSQLAGPKIAPLPARR
jgi:hypothetical protein